MPDSLPAERGVSNRVEFRCDLAEARVATRILRSFLAEQGLDETEQFNCELCLAEACNNAVQYVMPAKAHLPLNAEAVCFTSHVELRVCDHTEGFVLGERAVTLSPEGENGRGLFIIQTLMDEVKYFHGAAENTLVMRKKRTSQQHRPASAAANATLDDARRQLENCQQTISGMARELCFRSESLSAIFRCCTELGRSSDLEGFVNRLLSDLLHLTGADWYVLRLVPTGAARLEVFAASDTELMGEPITLGDDATADGCIELQAAHARRDLEYDARRPSGGVEPLRVAGPSSTGIVQPMLFGDTLVGTLAIGRRETDTPLSVLQGEMIRTFAEFIAMQVTNARHLIEQVHSRLVAHELDIAHRIQRALLPRTLPQLGNFGLAASWESARQVGGDFYDAIPLSDHSMLLVVADVMGKGVPAAMFATITRSLLRAMAVRSHHPAKLLKRLNELLYEELSTVGMFITAQLVFVDLQRRQIVAASAGHCPVFVLSGETVRTVRLTGTPLGILPHASYRQHTATLTGPAGLLLYTDGLTEAQNSAGEMFGQERLADWLRARRQLAAPAETMRDELATELARFRGPTPLRDDQAFLLLAEKTPVAAAPEPAGYIPDSDAAAQPTPHSALLTSHFS